MFQKKAHDSILRPDLYMYSTILYLDEVFLAPCTLQKLRKFTISAIKGNHGIRSTEPCEDNIYIFLTKILVKKHIEIFHWYTLFIGGVSVSRVFIYLSSEFVLYFYTNVIFLQITFRVHHVRGSAVYRQQSSLLPDNIKLHWQRNSVNCSKFLPHTSEFGRQCIKT